MNTNPKSPKNYFHEQLTNYKNQLKEVNQKIRRVSVLRIFVFLATVVGVYMLSGTHLFALASFGVFGTTVFMLLVMYHAKLHKQKRWFETLVQINKKELDLLAGKLDSVASGEEFVDHNHPFTSDLDIFGKRSLFQLVDRSATAKGRDKLAHTFMYIIKNPSELEGRQSAIKELKSKPEWRQHFQAYGLLSSDGKNTLDGLLSWVNDTSVLLNTPFNKLMLLINPILAFVTILLVSYGYAGFGLFVLFLLVPFAIIGRKFNTINHLHSQLGRKTATLGKYSEMFGMMESETYSSELLNELKTTVSNGTTTSTQKAIKKLSNILAAFDYRLNLLVGILLNIFFLWDILQCIRLEKWKRSYGKEIKASFEALVSLDELSSLAGFAFGYPNAVFPYFVKEGFALEAVDAKHPFIIEAKSVGNDIRFKGWGKFQIITGANMAGKSTYLRTVGINMVLAMTGAPVLAKKFMLQPTSIFTGIKTSDSLQDGESYFFAELKRLKEIINTLEKGEKLFIILDEILKGTNSKDKHKGSEGLVKQLIKLDASGIIATHDLALGQLEKNFPDRVSNKRFEVEIKDSELFFDYKLKEGVSQNLNATFLMKKMGITL